MYCPPHTLANIASITSLQSPVCNHQLQSRHSPGAITVSYRQQLAPMTFTINQPMSPTLKLSPQAFSLRLKPSSLRSLVCESRVFPESHEFVCQKVTKRSPSSYRVVQCTIEVWVHNRPSVNMNVTLMTKHDETRRIKMTYDKMIVFPRVCR